MPQIVARNSFAHACSMYLRKTFSLNWQVILTYTAAEISPALAASMKMLKLFRTVGISMGLDQRASCRETERLSTPVEGIGMHRLGTNFRPSALLDTKQVPDIDDSETNPLPAPYQQGPERSACRIMRVFRVFRFFRELGNWAMMILALKIGCVRTHNTKKGLR